MFFKFLDYPSLDFAYYKKSLYNICIKKTFVFFFFFNVKLKYVLFLSSLLYTIYIKPNFNLFRFILNDFFNYFQSFCYILLVYNLWASFVYSFKFFFFANNTKKFALLRLYFLINTYRYQPSIIFNFQKKLNKKLLVINTFQNVMILLLISFIIKLNFMTLDIYYKMTKNQLQFFFWYLKDFFWLFYFKINNFLNPNSFYKSLCLNLRQKSFLKFIYIFLSLLHKNKIKLNTFLIKYNKKNLPFLNLIISQQKFLIFFKSYFKPNVKHFFSYKLFFNLNIRMFICETSFKCWNFNKIFIKHYSKIFKINLTLIKPLKFLFVWKHVILLGFKNQILNFKFKNIIQYIFKNLKIKISHIFEGFFFNNFILKFYFIFQPSNFFFQILKKVRVNIFYFLPLQLIFQFMFKIGLIIKFTKNWKVKFCCKKISSFFILNSIEHFIQKIYYLIQLFYFYFYFSSENKTLIKPFEILKKTLILSIVFKFNLKSRLKFFFNWNFKFFIYLYFFKQIFFIILALNLKIFKITLRIKLLLKFYYNSYKIYKFNFYKF